MNWSKLWVAISSVPGDERGQICGIREDGLAFNANFFKLDASSLTKAVNVLEYLRVHGTLNGVEGEGRQQS
jgi:hypothetical protein